MSRRRNLIALLCASAPALASPRSDPTTGRAVFTGATEANVASLELNPAAIGAETVNEFYLSFDATLDQVHVDRTLLSLDGSTTQGPQIRGVLLNPGGNLGYIWHTPSDRITLGFALRNTPSETFLANRQSLRYLTLGGGQWDLLTTIAASLKVNDEFYVGASVAHDNTWIHLHYSRDTALEAGHGAGGVDANGIENPNAAENYNVEVRSSYFSTDNLRINLGFLWQIVKDVWVGVAYHPPPGFSPIETSLQGSIDVRRAPRDGGDLVHGNATVDLAFPATVDVEVRARLQHQLVLHVGGRWEDLSRFQGYDVRAYASNFGSLGIPEWTERARGFEDSFAIWGGVEQFDSGEPLRFGARLGFETESIPDDRTTPITIAPSSLTVDLGAQLRLDARIVLQLSYGVQLFQKVNVNSSAFDPRDRIDCINSGYDYSTPACAATRLGYAFASADGSYWRIEHAFRVGFKYDFH